MGELNFTAPTPIMINAFLKAMIKQNKNFSSSNLLDENRQPPIVKMAIPSTDSVTIVTFGLIV